MSERVRERRERVRMRVREREKKKERSDTRKVGLAMTFKRSQRDLYRYSHAPKCRETPEREAANRLFCAFGPDAKVLGCFDHSGERPPLSRAYVRTFSKFGHLYLN